MPVFLSHPETVDAAGHYRRDGGICGGPCCFCRQQRAVSVRKMEAGGRGQDDIMNYDFYS
jgi:hypothetical protein